MRLVLIILGFFIIAQLLGIYTGTVILRDISQNPFVSGMVVTGDSNDPANSFIFIAYILIGAATMTILIRLFGLHLIIFRAMEFMMIATSSSIVFYAFLRLALGYEDGTLTAIAMGLAFSAIKLFVPKLKNCAAIMATAGAGVVFGISLGVVPVILFLILMAIYDYISVFATKHMVELAEFVVKRDLAFTVTAQGGPPRRQGQKEGRMDLGTGDLIAPIMMEVSVFAWNPTATAFVFVGAVVSMAVFLFIVEKKRVVLPALPPIVFGMVAALLVGILVGAY